MKEIVVAGHVCVDVIPGMESSTPLTPGTLVCLGEAEFATGGAVSNTGLALHKLGLPVQLMGKIGGDFFGDILQRLLSDAGARHDLIISTEATSYTLVLNRPGMDRTFLHCPGANDTFSARDINVDSLRGVDLFHFGYPPLMRAIYADGGESFAALLRSLRDHGTVTSLDMARPDPDAEAGRADWAGFLQRVLPETDVFLPSLDELLFMLDRASFDRMEQGVSLERLGGQEFLGQLADKLISIGVAIVVIKLGSMGLFMAGTGDASRMRPVTSALDLDEKTWLGVRILTSCFQVDVAGTTGAGDCTVAGFLAAMTKGLDPGPAMDAATGAGAYCVEYPDATRGIPAWGDLMKRIESGWPRR